LFCTDPFKIEIIGDEKINFEVEATKRDTHAQKKYLKKQKKFKMARVLEIYILTKPFSFFATFVTLWS
jgi:hypothetical protein